MENFKSVEDYEQVIKNLNKAIPMIDGYGYFFMCDKITPEEKMYMQCQILFCPHKDVCAAFRKSMEDGKFVRAVGFAAECMLSMRSMLIDERNNRANAPKTLDFKRYSALRDKMMRYNNPEDRVFRDVNYYNAILSDYSEEEITYMAAIINKMKD